ncbi:putative retrotransposon protein [Tanacetum coccineum]
MINRSNWSYSLAYQRRLDDHGEVKKTDHSADVLALIKSQVPMVVDKYLGTKLDAFLRILERHTANLIKKYSVLPGPESIKNQESEKSSKEIIRIKKEQGEEKQESTYSIRSTDKVALEEFDLKNEYAMDKEVKDKVKNHKRKHDSDDDEDDDDDEGPSAGSNQGKSAKRRRHDSGASRSTQPPTKDDEQSSKKPRESDPESEHSEQSSDDIPMQDEGYVSDLEDTDNAYIPKVSTTMWFKLIPEGERPATPEPEWTIPLNDFPEPENNWANTYATMYQVPAENKLQRKTYDIGSFIKWFYRRTGKKKLCKADLKGPAFNLGFAAALAVLVTGASQSRQHESHHRFFPVDTSLIHIESRKSPTKSLFDVGSRRISIFTVNTKEYHSDVLAIITRIMRWSGLPPFQYQRSRNEKADRNVMKIEDTYLILLSFTHCGNKSIQRVLRIILVILPEHPSETMVFHNEDGNPARANIKQALGSYERPHKAVKASANSDIMYFFTSARDGDPLQDDVRLCLGDDLKKAQDHNQRQVDKTPYELWYGKVPNLSYLKVWGCEALVKRDTPDKLEQRSVKCIFIGYPKETMGYYFYFPLLKTKIVLQMVQSKGFVDPNHPRKVCKLQRSIYGLKQASRSWNKRFDEEIKRFGFSQNLDDPCVYQKASGSNVTFLILYVDDIIIMGELHWTAVKNILKYLRNTKDMFLVYGGNPSTKLRVECYCDAGFETDRDTRKSEYIAASEAAMEAVWIRKFISGLGIVPTINEPLNMYCDNSAAVHYANEPGIQRGARHYHRRYHYVRECVELGEIRILKVHTYNNLADPFTKALSNRKLTQHARGMGLRPASSFM